MKPIPLFLVVSLAFSSIASAERGGSLSARRYSVSPPLEALFGALVQCQQEESKTGCSPGFTVEQLLSRRLSIGITGAFRASGLFPNVSENLPAGQVGLSANYYGKGHFHGMWIQLHLKDKFYEIGEKVYSQTVSISPMVGYRWVGEDHPSNFGLAVGVEKNLSSPSHWLVLAKAEVGVSFLWSEIFN